MLLKAANNEAFRVRSDRSGAPMFQLDHPDTSWLTATNILLGLVALLFTLATGCACVREIGARLRRRRAERRLQIRNNRLLITHLGVRMSDGGKPVGSPSSLFVTEDGLVNPSAPDDKEESNIIRSDN